MPRQWASLTSASLRLLGLCASSLALPSAQPDQLLKETY